MFGVNCGKSPRTVFVAFCGNHSTEEFPWLSILVLLTYCLIADLRVFTSVMNHDSKR